MDEITNPALLAAGARLKRLLARARELELEEERQQRAQSSRAAGSRGKIIPFKQPVKQPPNDDPADPAA
jgi:hypothetical protein